VNPASTVDARERSQQRLARRREQGINGEDAHFLVMFVPEPLRLFKSSSATANDISLLGWGNARRASVVFAPV
jgi:hypothetical protein